MNQEEFKQTLQLFNQRDAKRAQELSYAQEQAPEPQATATSRKTSKPTNPLTVLTMTILAVEFTRLLLAVAWYM